MAERRTVLIILSVLLLMVLDTHLRLGIVAAMTDFLVVFLVVGIVLGVIYGKGD